MSLARFTGRLSGLAAVFGFGAGFGFATGAGFALTGAAVAALVSLAAAPSTGCCERACLTLAESLSFIVVMIRSPH
jgi:hypothetical protein